MTGELAARILLSLLAVHAAVGLCWLLIRARDEWISDIDYDEEHK